MPMDFKLSLGDAATEVTGRLPFGPVTMTELLPVLQGMTNQVVEAVSARLTVETGKQISCRAGCGACCRQLVPISVFEAEGLAAWVRSLPSDEQIRWEAKFDAALRALSEAGMLGRLRATSFFSEKDEAHDLAIDYFRAGVACPFLVDESCGIHPVRPLICREYVVVSPPEHCARLWEEGVVRVKMPVQMSVALMRIGGELEEDPMGSVPLVMLFEWMRLGLSPGRQVAGIAPEVLGRLVEALEQDAPRSGSAEDRPSLRGDAP